MEYGYSYNVNTDSFVFAINKVADKIRAAEKARREAENILSTMGDYCGLEVFSPLDMDMSSATILTLRRKDAAFYRIAEDGREMYLGQLNRQTVNRYSNSDDSAKPLEVYPYFLYETGLEDMVEGIIYFPLGEVPDDDGDISVLAIGYDG